MYFGGESTVGGVGNARQSIDSTPAGDFSDPARQGMCQQKTDNYPALYRANHATTLRRRCQHGGAGYQSLCHRGAKQTDREHAKQQRPVRLHQTYREQRRREQDEPHQQLSLARPAVAQRND
jgi:hypothetical protein